jgi:hypothetical protein
MAPQMQQQEQSFFEKRKMAFLQNMGQMGYDQNMVQQFIARHGLVAEGDQIVQDHL